LTSLWTPGKRAHCSQRGRMLEKRNAGHYEKFLEG
jgi:hypothetical protein